MSGIVERRPGDVLDATALAGVRVAVDGRYLALPGMGIAAYAAGLCSALAQAGASVRVLTNRPPRMNTDGWKVSCFGSTRNLLWDQVSIRPHLRRELIDLYWAPANYGIPLTGSRMAPTVVTVHDLVPLMLPYHYLLKRPLYGAPYAYSVAASLARATGVVTVSGFSASLIRRTFGRRAVVIPPVIRTSATDPAGGRQSGSAVLPTGQRYLLYHGGSDPRKQIGQLLQAFRMLADRDQDVHLVLMGRGCELWREKVRQLGLPNRVVLTGYVSDSDRDLIVANAFGVVYLSRMEGFGLPVLEGMRAGVPVIASRSSSLPELGGDAVIYVEDDAAASAYRAMLRLYDDEVRATCISRGLARAERYTERTAAEKVVALVQDLLTGGRHG